ncbi:hypothetical protein PMAYCL1PPCAC_05696 [Pristionchus mayeri]|uniref:Activin types I and II receptor domain-containing protein n=1 Tax=Pristionchus mayeri TaxID=1317129 RepID=A0AAN4ZAJ0_9BILA|nr:hypothetical protein PMAYCL1PPCAC_05696 [Pristionchus mayeri]
MRRLAFLLCAFSVIPFSTAVKCYSRNKMRTCPSNYDTDYCVWIELVGVRETFQMCDNDTTRCSKEECVHSDKDVPHPNGSGEIIKREIITCCCKGDFCNGSRPSMHTRNEKDKQKRAEK